MSETVRIHLEQEAMKEMAKAEEHRDAATISHQRAANCERRAAEFRSASKLLALAGLPWGEVIAHAHTRAPH